MTPERWAEIEALADLAHGLPAAEREAFLAARCRGDVRLRQIVEDLLAALDTAPDFLERPAIDLSALGAPTGDPLPTAFGRWRVLGRIGSGGMGEVFRATDGSGAVAAVKVMRADAIGAEARQRFALEQQMLAGLSHPNIARFLEAGIADDGRPWFAMAWVDGTAITTWCDDHGLDVDGRLRVFLESCEAVAHAHRALVLHRDIKPSNIVVDADGHPRLLDFGIGKRIGSAATGDDLALTRPDHRPLTVAYAAPEQLDGRAVTTAADVHALGLVLHELLTGLHPYRVEGATALEVERAVLESEPGRPSGTAEATGGGVSQAAAEARARCRGVATPAALRRRLTGDLDTIVLMALRKEPDRRYPSVEALADDVRRHLEGQPVRARPDTIRYRTRKFVRRNAGGVAVATVVALALVASWITALGQSRRATRAAAQVTLERDEAMAVRGFLLEMFGSTDASQATGSSESVRQMLDRQAVRASSEHRDQPVLEAKLLETIADAYERLGAAGDAVPLLRRAVELRRGAQGDAHADVAHVMNLLGYALHQTGASEEAESLLRDVVARQRARDAPVPLSRGLNDLGVLLNATSRYAEAESTLAEALAIRRQHLDPHDLGIGVTASNLAAAQYFGGRVSEAIVTQREAVAVLDSAVGPDHQRSVIALGNLASMQVASGDGAGAVAAFEELLARQTRIQGEQHPVTARVMGSLASVLGDASPPQHARAESLMVRSIAIQEELLGAAHPQVGSGWDRLAGLRLGAGRLPEALEAAARATTLLAGNPGRAHQDYGGALVRRGVIEVHLGRRQEGLARVREGLAVLRAVLPAGHPAIARALGRQCDAQVRAGEPATVAHASCRDALAALEAAPEGYRRDLDRLRRVTDSLGRLP